MIYFQLILAFCSTAVISFLLFYLLLKHKNNVSLEVVEKKDKAGLKKLKKELKKDQFSWQNMVMSKWVAFGGGFYGVMAVLTYVVVEFNEVLDLLTSEASFMATIAELGAGDLVNFFINSLMNFVTAISWPIYWMARVDGDSILMWFMAVYAGYVVGQFLAKNMTNPYANHNE